MNVIRTAPIVSGLGCGIWALTLAFVTPWFWVLAVLGALLVIAGGWPVGDPNLGYDTTVFGLPEPPIRLDHWRDKNGPAA
ncbi:hypothetical protein [Mycolicibacterium vaccae]|uniref:hypothetical protein n=1 Tax=Mycolicibacterium vaccae TaxID=1810 RepID=UPI003D043FF3